MATLVKNKNFFEFYLDNEKPYRFNINTGELLGIKGNPLKSVPSGFAKAMEIFHFSHNVLTMMYQLHIWGLISYTNLQSKAKLFLIADKLESIGFVFGASVPEDCQLQYVDKNWKAFCKWFNEHPNGNIDKFIKNHSVAHWLSKVNLKLDEHFTDSMAYWLKNEALYFSTDDLHWCAYYLSRGLWDYETNPWNRSQKLRQYFQYCEDLHIQPEKGDFMRVYVQAKRLYELSKEKIETEKLIRNQLAKERALTFEYDDMMVVIPTTTQEFIEEADMQSNCVARTYLSDVLAGRTNIVFIRKKNDPKTSYITCEVRDGKINQFLLKCNCFINKKEDADFRRAYQAHLDANW